jgi:hypothetical protein
MRFLICLSYYAEDNLDGQCSLPRPVLPSDDHSLPTHLFPASTSIQGANVSGKCPTPLGHVSILQIDFNGTRRTIPCSHLDVFSKLCQSSRPGSYLREILAN